MLTAGASLPFLDEPAIAQLSRKDYGRPGFGGRRVPPRTNRIAGIAVIGGLLALIFALVLADKS